MVKNVIINASNIYLNKQNMNAKEVEKGLSKNSSG